MEIFHLIDRRKEIMKNILYLWAMFISSLCSVQSKEISLKNAIDSAITNNQEIKNQRLLVEYRETLNKAGYTIEQAVLSVDYGQINSAYTDTKLSVTQRYQFPTVYSKQQSLLNEEWNAAILSKDLSIAQLKKTISDIYHTILILRRKEKILVEADSIYQEYVRISRVRLEKGESNILENSFHEIERGSIQMQMQELRNALRVYELQFQLLLNTKESYTPAAYELEILSISNIESDITLHPFLRQSRQSIEIAKAEQELEESRFLPDLLIGLSNHSIQGVGADNVLYPVSRRFNSFSIGIGIPHPFGAQNAKIEASKTAVKISEYEYQYALKKHQSELQSALSGRDSMIKIIRSLKETQLPIIEKIRNAANAQYISGEINYLEWTMAMHQTMSIQTHYLQSLQTYIELTNTIIYLQQQ
jgi:cobalt-zinc-cadmium resistance protein CzcA